MVRIDQLVRSPDSHYGERVRVRGYFILALENVSLLEPELRQESVLLNIQKLPAKDADDIRACRLKLVDVTGYVTHVPHRGAERTIIFAESMIAPSKPESVPENQSQPESD